MTKVTEDISWMFTEGSAYADEDAWHAAATRLRQESPIVKVEIDGWPTVWAIMKHADVMTIERRHDIFLNTERVLYQSDAASDASPPQRTIIQMDGAEHKQYRSLTTEYFTVGSLRRNLQTELDELSKSYVDKMVAAGGECDFVSDVAKYFPLRVILTMLGVPENDHPEVLRLTQEVFGISDPEFAASLPDDFSFADALLRLQGFLSSLTVARRNEPTDDIASVIANSTIDGAPIGDAEAVNYYAIIATAGHDTTSSVMGGGMEALLSNPSALRELQEDPSLMKNAVEEMLRWASPAKAFTRQATEDFELRGTMIRAGDRVLLSYPSANRDEEVFPDPFTFDIHRENANRHIAFGFGKHFCIGAELARMELRAFFTELLSRVKDIESAGPVERFHSTIVSGVKHLPIRYT
ncbi:MAG: cytochrome P450, partial [Aeromicrobium sp.]